MNAPRDPRQVPSPLTDEVDYVETQDVSLVHAAIRREKSDPGEATTPAPIWLIAICFFTMACAGFYLGSYNGGFDADVFDWYARPIPGGSGGAAAGSTPVEMTPILAGESVFKLNCATCHQATGLGIAGQYPPLSHSEYVNGGAERLGMILLKGIQGPIKVEGQQFGNAVMPAWDKLSDTKIAAVLSYVRQAWGNTGGEITPDQIAAARKLFAAKTDSWTEADLLKVPADATLPGGAPAGAPVQEAKK